MASKPDYDPNEPFAKPDFGNDDWKGKSVLRRGLSVSNGVQE